MGEFFTSKFKRYMHDVENSVNEFVIVFLSFGTIMATLYSLKDIGKYNWVEFGSILMPWVVMLGLMIIARELWILNNKVTHYLEQQSGE